MALKKGVGSSRNGRDSNPKYLGVKIYGVGIGSRSGEPVQLYDDEGNPAGFAKDADGKIVMTRLDEETLKSLAETTGGEYVHVDKDHFGLDEVRELM